MSNTSRQVNVYYKKGEGIIFNTLSDRFVRSMAKYAERAIAFKRARVGAFIASLFVEYQWLEAIRLSMTSSMIADGMGGHLRDVRMYIAEDGIVSCTDHSNLFGDFIDGRYCGVQAADILEWRFHEEGLDSVYGAFVTDGGFQDVNLSISRQSIASLLADSSISGSDIFHTLFSYTSRDRTRIGPMPSAGIGALAVLAS
jgi:hypothetical protein